MVTKTKTKTHTQTQTQTQSEASQLGEKGNVVEPDVKPFTGPSNKIGGNPAPDTKTPQQAAADAADKRADTLPSGSVVDTTKPAPTTGAKEEAATTGDQAKATPAAAPKAEAETGTAAAPKAETGTGADAPPTEEVEGTGNASATPGFFSGLKGRLTGGGTATDPGESASVAGAEATGNGDLPAETKPTIAGRFKQTLSGVFNGGGQPEGVDQLPANDGTSGDQGLYTVPPAGGQGQYAVPPAGGQGQYAVPAGHVLVPEGLLAQLQQSQNTELPTQQQGRSTFLSNLLGGDNNTGQTQNNGGGGGLLAGLTSGGIMDTAMGAAGLDSASELQKTLLTMVKDQGRDRTNQAILGVIGQVASQVPVPPGGGFNPFAQQGGGNPLGGIVF